MANLRQLAIDLIARDGLIASNDIKILKKHLFVDGQISRDDLEYLAEIRLAFLAKAKAKPTAILDKFFLESVYESVLGIGILSDEEVELLRKHVLEDKKLMPEARKLLEKLKKKASSVPPSFDALLEGLPKSGKRKK